MGFIFVIKEVWYLWQKNLVSSTILSEIRLERSDIRLKKSSQLKTIRVIFFREAINITDTVIKRQNNFKFLNYKIALLFYIWWMDGLDNVLDAQRLELAHNVSLKKFLTRAKLVFQFCKIWHEHTDTKINFWSKIQL